MASIKLQRLQKSFGSVQAVKDVTLDIADGEFISLLGPSGCGKTTTLRMVAGLEASNGGSIHIGEKDVSALSPRERDVAMVFQDYALYPHMTVFENVGYPLKVRGIQASELQKRVQEVASQLQIDMLLERRPGQLSGGQQQRVALARAVVHSAQVTLYDEPLSNLDTKLRLESRAFLKHLQHKVGLTSLYVTHDQAEAMSLSDRIVIMHQGEVMQVGSPMAIYRKPANTFVASFIGSPPMNLLNCTVDYSSRILNIEGVANLPFKNLRNADLLGGVHEVTLGIRPEHITLRTDKKEGCLPAQLYVIQELGSETLAIMHISQQFVTVRLSSEEAAKIPESVWLELQSERIFFFYPDGKLLA